MSKIQIRPTEDNVVDKFVDNIGDNFILIVFIIIGDNFLDNSWENFEDIYVDNCVDNFWTNLIISDNFILS